MYIRGIRADMAAAEVCAIVSSRMFSQRTNWKLSPNRFTQALEAARSSREPILDLTVSNPTLCGFAYDSSTILEAFHNPAALAYDPQPKGLLSARQEVARYYRDDHQAAVDPESLVLTASTSEADSYVFRLLCNPPLPGETQHNCSTPRAAGMRC